MTISLYRHVFASPTPFLALDQETDTRNHTPLKVKRNVYVYADVTYMNLKIF
jgi:hypothetical protein